MITLIGVDLGQSQDYTAISVIEATPTVYEQTVPGTDPEYRRLTKSTHTFEGTPVSFAARHLERILGAPYPDVVRRIVALRQAIGGDPLLVVDYTGCGRPVVDMIRESGLDPIAITITGGDTVTREGMDLRVPKRDLVGALVVALQTGRLKIARSLPDADTLITELLNFRVKISTGGHDSYEAWREGQHDDLVLSVGLAVWTGEYLYSHSPERVVFTDDSEYLISPI